MAIFAEYGSNPRDPSYLGLSKEPERQRPDQTVGIALQGAGELFSVAVEGVDTLNKTEIQKSAYKLTDPVVQDDINTTAQSIFDEAAKTQPTGAGLPLDITSAASRVQTMADARAAKKMLDVNFQGQVHEISQNLLSRFPGYRTEIEAAMDRATNTRGAAYRANLNTALQTIAAANATTEDKWQTELRNDATEFPDKPSFERAQATKDPLERQKIRADIAHKKMLRQQETDKLQSYNVLKQSDELDERSEKKAFNDQISILQSRYLTDVKIVQGGRRMSLEETEQFLNGLAQNPGPNDRTTLASITQQLGAVKQQLESSARAKALQMGLRFHTRTQIDDMVKSAGSLVDPLITFIGNKNAVLAESEMSTLNGMAENEAIRLWHNDPYARQVSALNRAYGPGGHEIVKSIISVDVPDPVTGKPVSIREEAAKSLIKMRTVGVLSKDGSSMNTWLLDWSKIYSGSTPPPAFINKVTEIPRQIATHPAANNAAVTAAAAVTSNPDTNKFVTAMKPEKQLPMYSRLFTPDYVDKVYKAGPEAWTPFKQRAMDLLKITFNEHLSVIQTRIEQKLGPEIKWNAGTSQLDYDNPTLRNRIEPPGEPTPGGAAVFLPNPTPTDPVRHAVDELNAGLRTAQYILDKDGIKLTPQMLKQLGVNVSKSRHPVLEQIRMALNPEEAISNQEFGNSNKTENTPATTLPGTSPNSTSEPPRASERHPEGDVRSNFMPENTPKGTPMEQLINFANSKSKGKKSKESLNLGEIISMDVQDIPEDMSARDFLLQLKDKQKQGF